MKKLIIAFVLLCGAVRADGCITLPDLGFACFTNDALAIPDFTHPYFQVSNSMAAVYPGSMNFPMPGMASPYITLSSSTVPCDGAHAGTIKYDNGHQMCGGSAWDMVVSGTSFVSMTTRVATDEASITANNTSATTSIAGKQASLGTSATTAYLRGDLAWTTLPTVAARSFSYPTRSLNTCFQPSATRDAYVTYNVDIGTSLSLSGGTAGLVTLNTYTNSGCSTGTQEVSHFVNSNTGALTIGLALNQSATAVLKGIIPSGNWAKLVTSNVVGTPNFVTPTAQEVLF